MNLLIVDDEPLQVKRLMLIDWKNEGFTTVYTAYNAKDALKIVENQEIAVLISDIRMPGCDGLKLYDIIQKTSPKTSCIFLSGYSEFDYVKEALRLKAIDYLTKPVDDIELLKSVEQAKKKNLQLQRQEENQKIAEETIFQRFLNHGATYQQTKDALRMRNQAWHDSYGLVSVLLFQTEIPLPLVATTMQDVFNHIDKKNFSAAFLQEERQNYYFLVNIKNPEALDGFQAWIKAVHALLQQTLDIQASLFYDETPFSIKECSVRFEQFKTEIFYAHTEKNHVISVAKRTAETKNHVGIFYTAPLFSQLFEDKNFSGITKKLSTIEKELADNSLDSPAIQTELFYLFINSLSALNGLTQASITSKIREALIAYNDEKQSRTIVELIHFLQSITRQLESEFSATDQENIVEKVRRLIRENITQDITLTWLAARLNYNASYLSTVYRERANENIKDAITREKIQFAKYQLRTTEIKINELSSQLGFQNMSYFSLVFKKRTGLSPSEYRNTYFD